MSAVSVQKEQHATRDTHSPVEAGKLAIVSLGAFWKAAHAYALTETSKSGKLSIFRRKPAQVGIPNLRPSQKLKPKLKAKLT